jgi:uncharacterized protein DUF3604
MGISNTFNTLQLVQTGLMCILGMSAAPIAASPYDAGKISEENFETRTAEDGKVYSPFAGRDYPDQVLFGDTHFHTNLSFDAGLIGTSLTVHDGFRVARGEKVISNTGQPVQLIRPLDFLAITDHSEMMGLAPAIAESNPTLLADEWGRWIHERFNAGAEGRMEGFANIIEKASVQGINPFSSDELVNAIWQEFVQIADEYNDPGTFTAMTGFEWTYTPKGDNLHRVVLFGDGADKTIQTTPFSMFDGPDPEKLWDYLAAYEKATGGHAIALPHNGNTSNGLMFSDKMLDGSPMTAEYAAKRIRWEPLHEMSQIKGDEETHPLLSPEDEFADYETWDVGNLAGSAPKEDWMLQYEYARSAMKLGLKLGKKLGVNPYQFGLAASTDTHTALPTSREENYFGKYQHTEPSPERHNREVIPADNPALRIMTSQEVASGLTAVWARENTRDAIFGALRRKEVYATTGSRLQVRVFGGYDYSEHDLQAADFASVGYGGGVPMGGNLARAAGGKAPVLMVRAMRDPDGANLDRIQVIKGWLDAAGETHERIYDVAVSGGRKIGSDGRCKTPVGNSVNIEKATYTNSIGDPILAARWADPDFDPKESAFYYVRVLEIPTPRWTTYDAAFYGIDRPTTVPPTLQDRAYTSPIWYSP